MAKNYTTVSRVQKLVNLNQNLYDQLTGAIFYLKKYADELDLPLKKEKN